MIGMSACFSGCDCTYRGDSNYIERLAKLCDERQVVLICPEVLGGLSVPRAPAEIISEDPLKVINTNGEDVTEAYIKGANKAIDILIDQGVNILMLKHNSPSCGVNSVYDGTFTHTTVAKDGVFARIAREKGLQLYTEQDIDAFFEAIAK